jgi:hypothetical protein
LNASIPNSTRQEKHNAIKNHMVQETAEAETLRVEKEDGVTNTSDLVMNVIHGQKTMRLRVGAYFKKQGARSKK